MNIILTKRGGDWHACLENHPEIWGCGPTKNEAIGDLISSHRDTFKIEVVIKTK